MKYQALAYIPHNLFLFLLLGSIKQSKMDTMAATQSFDESYEPFRLLRNSMLEAEPYVVYQGYNLGRCLDECLYRLFFVRSTYFGTNKPNYDG